MIVMVVVMHSYLSTIAEMGVMVGVAEELAAATPMSFSFQIQDQDQDHF